MSVQISAYIEDDIKEKMEHYSATHGLKKGFLIQNALDYYLNALHEIPTNMMVPSHMILSESTMDSLLDAQKNKANQKLKNLLAND